MTKHIDLGRLINFSEALAHAALSAARAAREAREDGPPDINQDAFDQRVGNQRVIYVPLSGQHVGAVAETVLDDGRCLTVYKVFGGVFELSVSTSVDAIQKDAIWLYPDDAQYVVRDMLIWDGNGHVPCLDAVQKQ